MEKILRKIYKFMMIGLTGCLIYMPGLGEELDENVLALGDLTVTADKHEEKIKNVPAAISAYTETDLEDAGISDISEVMASVPGMEFLYGSFVSQISFRGMATSIFTAKNPVVIYVDGVPYDNSMMVDPDLNNVERIEVLRGPQGALYGKSAIGGVVNIITKKPGNKLEGKGTVSYGAFETKSIKALVNGPITEDRLFFGFSANVHETRGFMKNNQPGQDYFDGKKSKKAKGRLRWTPSQDLEFNLHLASTQRRTTGNTVLPGNEIEYEGNRNPDDLLELDNNDIALDIEYTTGEMLIKSVTTYSTSHFFYTRDNSFFNPMLLDSQYEEDRRSITQEFRLQSIQDDENSLKWLAGLHYSTEDLSVKDMYRVADYRDYPPTYCKVRQNWPGELFDEVNSAFGQISIPFMKSFKLTAGLRYETIYKELDFEYTMTNHDTGALLMPSVNYKINDTWSATLPKAILSWSPTQEMLIYVSVADGYLAGGFNMTESNKDKAKFDAQTSRNYEIGTKTSWLDNKLLINALYYSIDIKDMHVFSSPQVNVYVASNAGKAHSRGIELELDARPIQGISISARYSQIDSKYDDYQAYDGDHSGNYATDTPAYTTSLAVGYRNASGLFGRIEMQGHGKTYYDAANQISQDPYSLYHAKVGYETNSWDVYLQGKNLTNTEYADSKEGDMMPATVVGAPRTVALVFSGRF